MKNILIILGLLICGITYSQQSKPSKPINYIKFRTVFLDCHAIFLDDSTLILSRRFSSDRGAYSYERYKDMTDDQYYVSYTPKDVIKLKEMFVNANELGGYAFKNNITTAFQKSLGYINENEYTFSYIGNNPSSFFIYAIVKYGRNKSYQLVISNEIFDPYYQYYYDLKQYKIQLKEFNEKTERDLELINKIK